MENTNIRKRFKHFCEKCNFHANRPSEWLLHIETEKHKRDGQQKSKICDICNLELKSHWIQKIHKLKLHSTIEERSQQKYYCADCDYVFVSKLYYDKHIEGKIHKNLIKALNSIN
jgi:hypothetical protein